MNRVHFESFGLSPELKHALADMNFNTPWPIQVETIPLLLENKDLIGQAQTGTGKTAAFAIPIIEKLDSSSNQVQALVLCPTRELAMQVADEFRKLVKYKKEISVVAIYGGQPITRQLLALQRQPQVIVGTPGRMLDHLWRGSFHLNGVKTVVLDEADEMLDMGFREDIEKIFDFIPLPRQTVLFSATMPKAILELTRKYQQNPHHIRIQPEPIETALIQEKYIETSPKTKLSTLIRLIDTHELKLALVFCNTKRQVDHLSSSLKAAGYRADGLHGGMPQNKRDRAMGHFRRGKVHILVATDVAARGIDVQSVQAVINYDIPERLENYKHRIGRTGRAGNSGLAFTFVSPAQLQQIQSAHATPGDNMSLFEAIPAKPSRKPPRRQSAFKRAKSNRKPSQSRESRAKAI